CGPQEQDGAKPDRWRGLILDESAPEDAIKLLGQPKKDGLGNLYVSDIENWLSRKYWSTHNGKAFRNLDYEKPSENINRALLSFLDNKLVGINIYPKNVKGAPTKEVSDGDLRHTVRACSNWDAILSAQSRPS